MQSLLILLPAQGNSSTAKFTDLFMCIKVQAGTITWLDPCMLVFLSNFKKANVKEMITDEYPSRNSQYLRLLTEAKPDLTLSLC